MIYREENRLAAHFSEYISTIAFGIWEESRFKVKQKQIMFKKLSVTIEKVDDIP